MDTEDKPLAGQSELLALEQQLEREWWWLRGALAAVAEMQVGRPSTELTTFRGLQALAREIDQRRLEVSVRMAQWKQVDQLHLVSRE